MVISYIFVEVVGNGIYKLQKPIFTISKINLVPRFKGVIVTRSGAKAKSKIYCKILHDIINVAIDISTTFTPLHFRKSAQNEWMF